MLEARKPSIQRRIRYAMMTTAEIGLLITLLFYSFSDYFKSRDALENHLQNLSRVVGLSVRSALSQQSAREATEALSVLQSVDSIYDAYLVNQKGMLLAFYSKHGFPAGDVKIPVTLQINTSFSDDWLTVVAPVKDEQGKVLGAIMLRSGLGSLYQQVKLNVLAALMITVLAIILAYFVAFRLQRRITRPIILLADHMKQVTVSQIYESHLVRESNDEIGQLYDQFNEMLGQVHRRDTQLNQHKDELEQTVKLRTEALNIANDNLKHAIDEANNAKEVALDAAKAKSAFLANMSHEIRTPMNGVLGMLEMMKDTQLDTTQLDYLETAYGSATSLLQIINDILDFSKIEAGKLELEQTDIDVHAIIEDIATLLASKAREKKIELSCYTDVQVPACVKGDSVRLRQILTNLLGNAVKFTMSGEVMIRAVVQSLPSDQQEKTSCCCVRFEVEDTGIGIAPDVIPTLFQPFTQADSSTTRKFGGTGLGLTISRQLVELMSSELKVRSALNKGSCFYFDVVFDISNTVLAQRAIPQNAQNALKGLYALIVDDNPTNRDILRHYLGAWKMDFIEADSGIQALEKIKDAKIAGRFVQLMYLDMQMPGMDGIELSKKMAEDPDLSNIKRIMLTSSGPMSQREQKAAFLDAALAKPYRKTQLLATTLEVMALTSEKTAFSQKQLLSSENKCIFSSNTKLLLVEDNLVNQKVASVMLKKLGLETLEIANNGREALEKLADTSYDLVLMDCQMPEMSGYEATRAIRKKEQNAKHTSHIHIVAMTANAMEGDREKCLEAGMDDYISKPIKLSILASTLKKWLPDNESTERSVQKETAPSEDVKHTLIDQDVFDALRQTEKTHFADYIQNYLTNADIWVKMALKNLHHKNIDDLVHALDALKKACHTLGGQSLELLVDQLFSAIEKKQWEDAASIMKKLTQVHNKTCGMIKRMMSS